MRALTLSIAGLSILAIACSASDGTQRPLFADQDGAGGGCQPFSQRGCDCEDGTRGIQLCNEDGQGFGACLDCGNGPAAGAGGNAGSGGGSSSGGDAGSAATQAGDLAAGIAISEISIYQSVRIPLMSGGTIQNPNAPVVAGKDALIRVLVTPGSGTSRQLVAELTLSDGGGETKLSSNTTNISAASTESNLLSSLNIKVPGEKIHTDTRYSVSLREVAGSAAAGGDTSGGTFPPDGAVPLGAKDPNGPLRIVVVPYRYLADGSGRLPITSDAQIETYRKAALAMYPVGAVEVSVRAPVDYSGGISQNGTDWGSWLNHLCSVRSSDNASGKDYYWGIAAPASGWNTWGGGVAGLGNVPAANDSAGRCAVGLGFSGADSAGLIMVHEIGHTLGRLHAPCSVGDADRSYPYSGAALGSWGYDSRSGQLKEPTSHRDFMSYCDPQWTSDYTYRAIFDRVSYVNSSFLIVPDPNAPPATEYQTLLFGLDDRVSWGYPTTTADVPQGEVETVELLDAAGEVTGTVDGIFMPFSHGGGQLLVPATGAHTRYIRGADFEKMDVTLQPSLESLRQQAGPPNLKLHVRPGHPSLN